MVLNHRVDKELEKDHLVHHPYPSTGSCIYHPFPADFSLVQEHINTTGVDTYKCPTSLLPAELPPAYSNLSTTAAQPSVSRRAVTLWQWKSSYRCSASASRTAQQGSKWKLGKKTGKTNGCSSVHGMGKTQEVVNTCWFKAPTDFKVTSWQQVLIFGPFKQFSDDDTNVSVALGTYWQLSCIVRNHLLEQETLQVTTRRKSS